MANVVSAYGPPGSDKITYSLSDQSNITISLTPTDADYGGYAPVASVGWVERSVTHHFFCHNFGIKAFPIS